MTDILRRLLILTAVGASRATGIRRGITAIPITLARSLMRVAILLLLPCGVVAQPTPPQILISPSAPTVFDVVQITVNTFAYCYPTGPSDGITTTVGGSTIQIAAILTCTSLTTPPPPLSFSRNVGPLAPGTYVVRYSASVAGTPPGLLASATFQVVAGANSIPTLNWYMVTLLIVCLAVVAWNILNVSTRSPLILGIACFAVSALLPSPSDASETAPPETIGHLAHRQLVLLFDPAHPSSPAPSQVIAAVVDPISNPALLTTLSHPADARRMLESLQSPQQFLNTLAANPKSPRALLEQYVVLTYIDAATAITAKADLTRDPRILSVELNGVYSFSPTPNDTYFSYNSSLPNAGDYQWGMQLLNLPNAWDKARGTAYIAALDNGIYCSSSSPCVTHSDLQQNLRTQFSRNVGSTGSSTDIDEYLVNGAYKGHGTHVAGIIAATSNNSAGVAGACWTCSLSVIKFDLTWVNGPTGVTFAGDHGIQVINMSFGDEYDGRIPGDPRFTSCSDAQYQAMCQAIAYAKDRDVVVVAASGNGYENRIQYPAQHSDTIAVGGVQYGGSFWNVGYGFPPTTCQSPPVQGDECGSNYGTQTDASKQIVAPAKDIISTFYPGYSWSPPVHCADTWGPNSGVLPSGYGDCTGTSMSAPHVTGIAGLVRSVNPLLGRDQIKAILLGNTTACTGSDAGKCGAGIPDAAKAVTAALGGPAVKNRLTPLFSFFSSQASDHLYTIVPQMALAALNSGELLPQPPSGPIAYVPVGNTVPSYSQFPQPSSCFSPCPSAATPKAMVSVFTSHVDPTDSSAELIPLYRMSWSCTGSCSHVSHLYVISSGEISLFQSAGYVLDGIEGYIYPSAKAQPSGTVKLCRKYAPSPRDDYILFPGTGTNGTTCGNGDGFTDYDNNGVPDTVYTQPVDGTDWIGWAYPVRASTAVCARGVSCTTLTKSILLPIFGDD